VTDWKPKLKTGARFEGLNLTGEEGFVLSRLDGQTSLRDVTNVTGLPEGRVRQIIDKLVHHGAVEADAGGASSVPGGRAAATQPARTAARRTAAEASAEEVEAARAALLDDPSDEAPLVHDIPEDVEGARANLGHGEATLDDQPPLMTEDADELPAPPDTSADNPDEQQKGPQAVDEVQIADAPDEERKDKGDKGDDEKASRDPEKSDEENAKDEAAEANYRQLYETELSKLELVEREAMARSAKDPHLSALCFDAMPSVIKGILENNNTAFQQARLIARHHRTPQGLDFVLNRAEFFRDTQTQRLMLANPMLQDVQIRKLLGNKRLADIYKQTINRDLPERNRQKVRMILRTKWSTAEGEERAGLVFSTEGRCLNFLTGLPFDSQTVSMLCAKTYNSVLLIQNLARFSATPPLLLNHLARQAIVRRQAHLKTMILQHPNCPSDLKRKI
jgi:hypothetical protein